MHLAQYAAEAAARVPIRSVRDAHDLRNLLATLGLHVETLERLSGPRGAKAADAAHAIISRAAALCNAALDSATRPLRLFPARQVDIVQTASDVADLLATSAPEGFLFDIEHHSASAWVLADPDDAFRILFNLMQNAVKVAQRSKDHLTALSVRAVCQGSIVMTRVADNGPGLPLDIRAGLFGTLPSHPATKRHGYGLSIARQLAERNGGALSVEPSRQGTTFVLQLPAYARGNGACML